MELGLLGNTNFSLRNGGGTHSGGYSGDQLSGCSTLNGKERQPTGKAQQCSSEYWLLGRGGREASELTPAWGLLLTVSYVSCKCAYMCVYMCTHMGHGTPVEVRRYLVKVNSLPSSGGSGD